MTTTTERLWIVYVTLCNEQILSFKIKEENLSEFQEKAWRMGVQNKTEGGSKIEFVNPLFIKTIVAEKQ